MPSETRPRRSLLNPWSALGLMAAAGVAFAAVFPMSRAREGLAFTTPPDMLALSYLDLALARSPNDTALRLRVAERTLAAGRFDRAREVLAPLLAERPAQPDAALLHIEVDYRAWAATDPDDARLRGVALARLTETIRHTEYWLLATSAMERIAWVCGQVGLEPLRAALLERVARMDLSNDERLRAADAAHLELGHPLASATLRADRALGFPDRDGEVNASLALGRALASGEAGPALLVFRKLRATYAKSPHVLELGLSALAGVDDVEALAVARELLALRPDDEALHQRIALLSAWTRPAPPPAPPHRVPPPAPPPPLRWGTEGTESANGTEANGTEPGSTLDEPLTARLLASGDPRAIERAALLDSLGEPERALALIDRALSQQLVDERALWDLKVGVQLRLGQKRDALTTLEQMDDRFGPTAPSIQRRAELLLSLGELEAALLLLGTAPGPRAVDDERRITAIGWELGDLPRVRAAYRAIARSPEATAEDVRRLWLLERDAGELAASARTALGGYRRFAEPGMLQLALATALASKDDALVASVLAETADADVPGIDAENLRLHVSARQERAHRALLHAEHAQARAELDQSAKLLARAGAAGASAAGASAGAGTAAPGDPYGQLWQTQDRQMLSLALAVNDRQMLARVYPEQQKNLSARERVFVLHRLGRDEEAVTEAVSQIERGDLPEHDTGALEADADALGARMPRQFSVLGDVVTMAGLTAARAGANVRAAWSGGRVLGAQVEITRLGSGEAPSLYLAGQDELAAELSAGLADSVLTIGVVALDARAPRPSLRFEQGLLDRDDDGDGIDDRGGVALDLVARLNERSRDTPVLRVIGVEDELSARASIEFLSRYSASVRGSAKLYSDRDRHYLGAGATVDAAVGRNFTLPGDIGNANLRVAGYVAPRFAEDAAGSAAGGVPDGASWVGFGASLSRGQLSFAPVAGRRLSVLADVTAGWLMPLDELGWSARFGLGISVLGADQLSIFASASNVMSTVPGFAAYTLGADYAVSRW